MISQIEKSYLDQTNGGFSNSNSYSASEIDNEEEEDEFSFDYTQTISNIKYKEDS